MKKVFEVYRKDLERLYKEFIQTDDYEIVKEMLDKYKALRSVLDDPDDRLESLKVLSTFIRKIL